MLVSHDPLDTLSWADEILVLRDGKVVQQGPPMQVYQTPVDEYVAGLFGKYNLIDGRIVRPEQIGILSVERPGVLKGRIETMSFWGSFFEATVLTDSGLYLTVRVWGTSLAAGDLVYVTVP